MARKSKKSSKQKSKKKNILATRARRGLLLSITAIVCCLLVTLYRVNEMIDNHPLPECGHALAKRSIPLTLAAAVIAQEDHSFLNHKGINWREVKQAFWVNLQLGRIAYGASTLDMQVASLCYLKKKKLNPWMEKVFELAAVYILSKRYSKEEILRAYLTIAPFADNTRGFEAASQLYFNKKLMELDFEQEWSLVLALRNKDSLSPDKTAITRKLPKKIAKQWVAAKWRQTQTLKWQSKKLLLFRFLRNKSF